MYVRVEDDGGTHLLLLGEDVVYVPDDQRRLADTSWRVGKSEEREMRAVCCKRMI
jgi:hypothetical protein